jgi:3-oxoacyl-[acyl-carrier protein] reductase
VPPDVKSEVFQADLSTYDGARALHAEVVEKMGPIEVLFNNSGVTNKMLGRKGSIEDMSPEEFESTWRTNCGTAFLVRETLASGDNSG